MFCAFCAFAGKKLSTAGDNARSSTKQKLPYTKYPFFSNWTTRACQLQATKNSTDRRKASTGRLAQGL